MAEEKSVLWVGGLAGILAGIIVVVGIIIAFTLPPQVSPPDLERDLETFPENRILSTVALDLFLVALLLFLPFLAALYRSLREPSRVFARIGLGSGILAVILLIVALQGILHAQNSFSALYEGAAAADRPVVVATYGAVESLFTAGVNGGLIFLGLAFVAFGLAMRRNPGFGEGLAWLSAVLGILIVLLTLLILALVGTAAIAVFALVFGWKVYSLSRAASPG